MGSIRIIGDVHGKLELYRELCLAAKYSVCLGEMGFDLRPMIDMYLDDLDGDRHIIVPGNHDNYHMIRAITTFLDTPGYGMFDADFLTNVNAFYVRGAASIDKAFRTEGVSWWSEEELGMRALQDAIDFYSSLKPDIMVTHTAPDSIVAPHLLRPDQPKYKFRTEQALQVMLENHAPKLWVFGHFHLTKTFQTAGTTFVALGELATCDLDLDTLSFTLTGKDGYNWGDGGY
jgi:predicted phosphodiesterase